jgi:hypothetical protein
VARAHAVVSATRLADTKGNLSWLSLIMGYKPKKYKDLDAHFPKCEDMEG